MTLRINFLGPLGILVSRWILAPMYRLFFRDIPETKVLFDIDCMIQDGQAFDCSSVPDELLARSWIPSYYREPAGEVCAQRA